MVFKITCAGSIPAILEIKKIKLRTRLKLKQFFPLNIFYKNKHHLKKFRKLTNFAIKKIVAKSTNSFLFKKNDKKNFIKNFYSVKNFYFNFVILNFFLKKNKKQNEKSNFFFMQTYFTDKRHAVTIFKKKSLYSLVLFKIISHFLILNTSLNTSLKFYEIMQLSNSFFFFL